MRFFWPPISFAELLRQILHILANPAVRRSPRVRSGQWIGAVTGTEGFRARVACACHHPKDPVQFLLRAWLSTAVRHATAKSVGG
eukprot:4554072-Karenia_brevis.AAC.1